MALAESIFDILYLSTVIALGIRLFLQKDKNAKSFGIMGIVLGLGDSFHLLPRIISHWSSGGFEANEFILSWGKAITSLTMTCFYLLYYHFLKNQTGDKDKKKDYLIYFLFIVRMILILLPQNEWGTLPGNYLFSILRNIPFAIMGALLVVWSYKNRETYGIKYMATLISLSFIFYAPVVLFVNQIPAIGAFMIPKTVAYFLIVYIGYKRFMPKFEIKQIAEIAFVYLIFGLFAGVFYRTFTSVYNFVEETILGKIHAHLLALGVLGILILYMVVAFISKKNPEIIDRIKKPLFLWNIGLILSVSIMMINGIIQVLGFHYGGISPSIIAGISGIGHVLLGSGLILSLRLVAKS